MKGFPKYTVNQHPLLPLWGEKRTESQESNRVSRQCRLKTFSRRSSSCKARGVIEGSTFCLSSSEPRATDYALTQNNLPLRPHAQPSGWHRGRLGQVAGRRHRVGHRSWLLLGWCFFGSSLPTLVCDGFHTWRASLRRWILKEWQVLYSQATRANASWVCRCTRQAVQTDWISALAIVVLHALARSLPTSTVRIVSNNSVKEAIAANVWIQFSYLSQTAAQHQVEDSDRVISPLYEQ